MTQYLYDALNPAGIPLLLEVDAWVAAYADHPEVQPPGMEQLATRFPNHRRFSISAHGGDADIGDVERGAMTAADLVEWLPRQRARGIEPAVYAAPDTWRVTLGILAAYWVPAPPWWAVMRGAESQRPAGSFANQFLGAGGYDKSIIYGPWPGVNAPLPAAPSGGGQLIGDHSVATELIEVPDTAPDLPAGVPSPGIYVRADGTALFMHVPNFSYESLYAGRFGKPRLVGYTEWTLWRDLALAAK